MERYDIDKGLTPYERLAAAIVRQAVLDFYETKAYMSELKRGGSAWEKQRCNLYLIEKWFLSDWCCALTYGQNEELLRRVKKGEI